MALPIDPWIYLGDVARLVADCMANGEEIFAAARRIEEADPRLSRAIARLGAKIELAVIDGSRELAADVRHDCAQAGGRMH